MLLGAGALKSRIVSMDSVVTASECAETHMHVNGSAHNVSALMVAAIVIPRRVRMAAYFAAAVVTGQQPAASPSEVDPGPSPAAGALARVETCEPHQKIFHN